MRELGVRILERALANGRYADELVERTLRRHKLAARDRNLLTELVNGTLRWHGQLEWLLDRLLAKGVAGSARKLRWILELALYQLRFADRIPDYAAVDASVALARKYGGEKWARLANGVLRQYLRDQAKLAAAVEALEPTTALAVRHSHPEWLVKRWIQRYGWEATARLCAFDNRRPAVTIRLNRLKASTDALARALADAGIEATPSRWVPGFFKVRAGGNLTQTEAFGRGWFFIQDESTALPVHLLDPRPGEHIVDLCAAPGGKTGYVAERQGDAGRILAIDRTFRRLRLLKQNVRRLGLASVTVVAADATALGLKRKVDKVLLDAPCTGLGVLARRADLRWKRTPEDIGRIQQRQRALIENAGRLLKPGGILVYSTCTLEPEENEEVVEGFLRAHPEFAVDGDFRPALELGEVTDGLWRTLPQVHEVDGTFAVRLRMVDG